MIFTALLILSIVLIFVFSKKNISQRASETDGGLVTLQDLPNLVDALKTSGKNGSFFVLLIPGTAEDDGYDANLQFSIDNNEVGIDWVLIAKSNIKMKDNFMEISTNAGLSCKSNSGNNVVFLRATGNKDLARIGQDIIHKMFPDKIESKMKLIITGMKWDKIK